MQAAACTRIPHLVGLPLFKYQDDARSNTHKIHSSMYPHRVWERLHPIFLLSSSFSYYDSCLIPFFLNIFNDLFVITLISGLVTLFKIRRLLNISDRTIGGSLPGRDLERKLS